MTLVQKIISIYPELTDTNLVALGVFLQNDLDERGDYIARWEHPTLTQPTQEQLDGVTE